MMCPITSTGRIITKSDFEQRLPSREGSFFYSGTFAGVMPNSEQLAAMGLTRAQARALLGK